MRNIDLRKIGFTLCAGILLVTALYIRANGMFDVFHTDEDAIMEPVEIMSKTFSFDPDCYQRPNHISIYVNFVIQNLYSLIRYGDLLANTYDQHVSELFAIARIINAVFGVLMAVFAYLIGCEFSKRIGIISAFLCAFFPVFCNHSHVITPDILTACITMLMIFLTIKLVKKYDKKTFLLLCFTCALNIIEKYPGLISISLVFFILVLQEQKAEGKIAIKKILPIFIKYGLLVVLFCYLLSPSLFIHPKHTLYSLLKESKGGRIGSDGLGYVGNLIFYCKTFFVNAGMIATAFFIIGVFRLFLKRENISIKIPLLYGFLYWILMSALPLHWERWGMPMYIAPIFVIAFGVDFLFGLKNARIPVLILFGISVLNMANISLFLSTKYHFTTTTARAKEFLNEQGITRENTIYEGYTPFHEFGPSHPFDWFEKKDNPQYRYVITSSGMKNRYMAEPNRDPRRVKAYTEIEGLELIRSYQASPSPGHGWFESQNFLRLPPYTFMVYRDNFKGYDKGPTLWIHKIR